MKLSQTLLLILSITVLLCASCRKRLSPNAPNPRGKPTPEQTIKADFVVYVQNEDKTPIDGADVTVGDVTIKTNKLGIASFYSATVSPSHVSIKALKSGYHKGYRANVPIANGANYVHIALIKQNIIGHISASSGGEVISPEGVKIKLPANAVSGYTGNIDLAVKYLDATKSENVNSIPGDLLAKDSANRMGMLDSYGMAAIDLLDANGNPLQLAPGKQAEIVMPIPATKKSKAKPTIPLWYFNESAGIWKQEGEAKLEGDKYVGKVSHFSWWNCDRFMYTQNYCFEVFVAGVLAPNLVVEVLDKESGMRASAVISVNGKRCFILPINGSGSARFWIITMWMGGSSSEWKQCSLGTVEKSSADAANGNLVFKFDSPGQVRHVDVVGKANKCASSQKVTNGVAVIRRDSWSITTLIKDGEFDFGNQLMCLPPTGTPSAMLTIYDFEADKESKPKEIFINNFKVDVGTIEACDAITAGSDSSKEYVGNLILETQQEVDDIASQGYTHIKGLLRVFQGSNNPITSLIGLSSIRNVTGDMVVNASAASLAGLHNLTTVGGALSISSIEAQALYGLGRLKQVGGDLTISSCNAIRSLEGLSGLTNIGGNFTVQYNKSLRTFAGINPTASIIGGLFCRGNDSLENITMSQSSLRYINIYASGRHAINNISFPNLTSLAGAAASNLALYISEYQIGNLAVNKDKETKISFPELTSLAVGGMWINTHSININELHFPKLKTASFIHLDNRSGKMPAIKFPVLETLTGFTVTGERSSSIQVDVVLENLAEINFGNLKTAPGELTFNYITTVGEIVMDKLTACGGISINSYVGNHSTIKLGKISFANLSSVYNSNLRKQGRVSFYCTTPTTPMVINVPKLLTAGDFSISCTKPLNQTPLLTITLSELKKITGNATITFDQSTNLTMPKLDSILGNSYTESVRDTTISYYSSLKYVGGRFNVSFATALSDITALTNLNYIGGELRFVGNTKLKNFCALKTMLNNGGLKGAYTVSGNAYNPTINDIKTGICTK